MSYKRKPENIAFSIIVTPDKKKKLENEEEGLVAVLAPFNPFPKISFDNVKLHTTATREVYLVNPTKCALQVELTKLPDEARGFEWSAIGFELPQESQVKLVISWTPSEYGSWHDNVKIVNKKTKKPLSELKLSSTTEEPPKVSKWNKRCKGIQAKKKSYSSKQEGMKKTPAIKSKSENKENEVMILSKPNKQTVSGACIQNENVIIFESKKLCQNKTFTQINENDLDDQICDKTSEMCIETVTVFKSQNSNRLQLGPSTPRRGTYDVVVPVTSSRRSTYSLRTRQISNILDIENEKRDFELLASPGIHNDSLEKAALKLVSQQIKKEHTTFDETEEFDVGGSSRIATTFTLEPSVNFNCLEDSASLGTVSSSPLLHGNQIQQKGKLSVESEVSSEKFYDSLEERKSLECLNKKSGTSVDKSEGLLDDWDEVYDFEKFSSISEKSHGNKYSVSEKLKKEDLNNLSASNQIKDDLTYCLETFPEQAQNLSSHFVFKSPSSNITHRKKLGNILSERFTEDKEQSGNIEGVSSVKSLNQAKESFLNLGEEFDKFNFTIVSSSPVDNKNKLSDDINKTYTSVNRSTNEKNYSFRNNSESLNINFNASVEDKVSHMDKRILNIGSKCSKEYPNISTSKYVNEDVDKNTNVIVTETKTPALNTPARFTRSKLSLPLSISSTNSAQSIDQLCLPTNSTNAFEPSRSSGKTKTDFKKNQPEIYSKEVFLVPSILNKRSSLQKSTNGSPPKIRKISQEIKIKRLSTPLKSRKLPFTSSTEEKRKCKLEDIKSTPRLAMSVKKRKSLKVADWVPAGRKLKLSSVGSQSEEEILISPVDLSTPDPYLAATTLNPFAKGGLYFNNKWLEEQKLELIQWADRMLRPPSELQLDRDQSEHSTLHRLNALRATAFSILTSTEVATVLSKVKIAVDRNIISIRADRQLHADLGLQDKITSLLMSYNPLWLRLCLEVVYQCNIQLRCHSDHIGLRDFIRRYVLNNDYLRQKHSHPTIPHLMLPQFEDEMKKFTVYKFLVIVYLLDLVKSKKLILHDPCLFKKDSKFKSSKEVLLDFNKEFVASAGDITRILRLRGYIVSHCQTYIDEFDFSLSSLVELRDGIRLTRLAENLVRDNTLCSKLRVPAVSNLQKKFNAEVAFSALIKAGYDLPSDVVPKDISDGHHEKTLSFLWHLRCIFKKHAVLLIIAKWHETKQLRRDRKNFLKIKSSVIKIQRWYRKIKRVDAPSEEELKRGCEAREYFLKLRDIAVRLQRMYRKRKYESVQKKKFFAAQTIQIWYRNQKDVFKDRNNFKTCKKAAITIQKAFRRYKSKKDGSYLEDREYFLKIRAFTVMMQRRFRLIKHGNHQRQQFLTIKTAAIKIQRRFRANKLAWNSRNRFVTIKRAAVTIQRRFRAFLTSKQQRHDFINKKAAVIVLQKRFRAYKQTKTQRQEFLKIKTATVTIQRMYRSFLIAKKQREEFLQLKKATIIVQRKFREKQETRICRNNFLKVKKATFILQRRFRSFLLTKHQREQFLEKRNAVIVLQRRYRASKLMKYQRKQFLTLKAATITIQRKLRVNKLAKIQRDSFLMLKYAAIKLQRRFRLYLLTKCQNKEFLAKKSAAIKIQRRFRAKILAKHQREWFLAVKSAAITIQRKFRYRQLANKQRQDYIKMKSSAITIQRKYRAQKLAKQQRKEMVELKTAVVKIQRKFRTLQIARKQRQNYLTTRTAAVTIQRMFRSNKEAKHIRHKFIQMRNAAIKIQRKFKAFLLGKRQRQDFITLKSAVIVIQKRFKTKKLAENQRKQFLSTKAAALTIQRRFKSSRLAKQQRQNFLKEKNAAIIIQQMFRSNKKTKLARKQFLVLKTSTITIQRRFRGVLLARRQRKDYLELKNLVVNIQRRFRSKRETKKLHEHFTALKTVAVKIQRRFRELQLTKQQRQEFLTLKAASLVIQRKYRGYKLAKQQREEYISIKLAAVTIQRRLRSLKLTRKERKHFLSIKFATVKVQRIFRAKKEARSTREHFLKIKNAALTIQRRYRLYLLACSERKRLLTMKKSAVNIQRRFRALKLAKMDRKHYIALRTAAVTIQTRFRAFLVAKHQRQEFLRMKGAVLTLQRKFKATKQAETQRKHFLALKSAAVTIQTRFRALLAMKYHRQEFNSLKNATITIQRLFKAKCLAKYHRQNFIRLKEAAITIQKRIREKRIARTLVEDSSLRRENDAALRIQAVWRGYSVRKNCAVPQPSKTEPKVVKASTDNNQPLSTRGTHYFRFLSNHRKYSVAELQNTLFNIDKITVLSADQCEYFVKNGAVKILYDILEHQSNRAFGVHTCVELILSILLNFYRAPVTAESVWKETTEVNGIFHVFDLMMRFKTEKTSTVFCKACTVIWLFAQDPNKAKIMMNTPKVQETYNYVVKSMKKNEQPGTSGFRKPEQSRLSNKKFMQATRKKFPALRFNCGNYFDDLRAFDDKMFALNSIMDKLGRFMKK